MLETRYIRWFKELSLDDLGPVGGKNASLGELLQQLTSLGVRVPDGFAVAAVAYNDALDVATAWPELKTVTGDTLSVAVRSSATAEDLSNASFAGQHDTNLNVQGDEMLIDGFDAGDLV